MTSKTEPLAPEALYTACDPTQFAFRTTAEIEPTDQIHGQPRAVEAVRFAIGMRSEGYNLFAAGPEGVGRFEIVDRFLRATAIAEPVPEDWCYVNNFAEPHKPSALRLPPGRGCALRADMTHLVDDLRAAIPAAFESDEYRNRRSVIEESIKELHEEHFGALQEEAKGRDVAVIQTPMGLAVAPLRDGEVLAPKDFEALPEDEKESRKAAMEEIQKKLEETLRQMPSWGREGREKLRQLNQEVTRYAVGFPIEELKRRWQDIPAVVAYLEAVRNDVIENVEDFLPAAPPSAEGGGGAQPGGRRSPTKVPSGAIGSTSWSTIQAPRPPRPGARAASRRRQGALRWSTRTIRPNPTCRGGSNIWRNTERWSPTST